MIKPQKNKPVEKLERIIKNGLRGFEKMLKIDNSERPLSYFEAFLKDKTVASITPSSKYLVRRVIKAMDIQHSHHLVVEYGAAEGVLTKEVLKLLPSQALLLAIEKSPILYETLTQLKHPNLKAVCGDVLEIDKLLKQEATQEADCIVSGIPFSFLKPEEREELLKKTTHHLKPSGRFVAYQCTTHLIPLLKKHFRKVQVEFEIRNIPPHFVFTGIK
ncbi:MAG: methyltransferase domain-containing protein [Elusimicrobia bacterium]|nr:methyltransferase domain-containing protein [Elusimicrobiota bacterium]